MRSQLASVVAIGLVCAAPGASASSVTDAREQDHIAIQQSAERQTEIDVAHHREQAARLALAEAELARRLAAMDAKRRQLEEALGAQRAARTAALHERAAKLQAVADASAAAQRPPQPPPSPPVPPSPPAPPAGRAPVAGPVEPPPLPPLPKNAINIQVEVTITDQMGSGAPTKKTVTLLAVDSTWARIRASATALPARDRAPVPVELNVDARPRILAPGQDAIQVELTMEYRPLGTVTAGEPSQIQPTNLNQSLTVILQNGKPLVVSQAADPVSDRRIVAEVRATALK